MNAHQPEAHRASWFCQVICGLLVALLLLPALGLSEGGDVVEAVYAYFGVSYPDSLNGESWLNGRNAMSYLDIRYNRMVIAKDGETAEEAKTALLAGLPEWPVDDFLARFPDCDGFRALEAPVATFSVTPVDAYYFYDTGRGRLFVMISQESQTVVGLCEMAPAVPVLRLLSLFLRHASLSAIMEADPNAVYSGLYGYGPRSFHAASDGSLWTVIYESEKDADGASVMAADGSPNYVVRQFTVEDWGWPFQFRVIDPADYPAG